MSWQLGYFKWGREAFFGGDSELRPKKQKEQF